MARKAGNTRIKSALGQYAEWRRAIDARIGAVPCANARVKLTGWADDVRARIVDGELGICTSALIRSVARACEDFESGYYVGMEGGGFRIRN